MRRRLIDTELVGVTESTATLAFAVEDEGEPSAALARVTLDGETRAECAHAGLRLVRLTGLEPQRDYAIGVEVAGADPAPELPLCARTLAAPDAELAASLATLNDLHFGEERFGGIPGVADDVLEAGYTAEPYWRFMNHDAIDEINRAGVDAVIVKGDIADRGRADQFAIARAAFDRLASPWHAFLGNHDAYGEAFAEGYRILGQPPAPRAVSVGGWRLVMLDTVAPELDRGHLPAAQLAWLDTELAAHPQPTLLFMHHQAVPPAFANGLINRIGVVPADSARLFAVVAAHEHVRGVLAGHTHRNRVRRYPEVRGVPFVEVACTKDYPGVWAHYRLYRDGSFRQEMRRTGSRRALGHSQRCGRMFDGRYRAYALGSLADRSFAT